jgi:zinc protease
MNIQRVTSPGGIEAWLVESHANPLIAMRFGFRGGAAQDPAGKEGLAYFVSGMMDEGAGDLDSVAYQEQLQTLATRIDFDAGRDVMLGTVQTLTENRDAAFNLLRLALTAPRFDVDATERVRAQILAGLIFDENDPETVASLAWDRLAFEGHPYGRPIKGTTKAITDITPADLNNYVKRIFGRDKLLISVVGDIDAKTLGALLDHVFGSLPEKSSLTPVADANPPLGPTREVITMDVPQSVAQFGHRGFQRKDADFMGAYVLNYIIGGGGFSSRLMEEVREKRGLAYSVYSNLYPYEHGAVFVGNVATKNEEVGRSLRVIEDELRRLAEQGPSAEELDAAKSYLTGAYALRFESSSSIANQLLWMQIEDLGIDYVDQRNAAIEAVSLDDIRRVAKRLIEADRLITTIVGKPVEHKANAPG